MPSGTTARPRRTKAPPMRKLALLIATALTGCNFAPAYRRPVAPISAAYPTGMTPNVVGSLPTASEVGWREYFGDPRLQALIAAALERNRNLAESVARIEQARAQYRIQDSQRLPTIDVNSTGTRSRQPTSALGFGDALGGGAAAPSAIELTQYTADVGVSAFELDFWGRLRNLAEAERARYLASIEGARAFRLTLIAQVASAYFDIRGGEERIALAERSISGRREGVRIARLRLDAGVTSTVDADQAELLLTQAQTELADVRRSTEVSANLLELLAGGPIRTPLPPGRPLVQAQQVRAIEAGLPSALLVDRPDILEAEYNLRAANANIGALRALFFPNISLTAAYGFASPVLGDLFDGGSTAWNAGGAINLPIFDWGRRRAQVRQGRAQAAELIATYQVTVQAAFQDVADALVGRRRYAEQIAAQERTVAAQRRIARAARLRYDNGIAIYLEVLDAERNLFTAEQQLVELRTIELQNAVTLYTALGGGAADRAAPLPDVLPTP